MGYYVGGQNNVQPIEGRNLLIASECSKSLNPNWDFGASYDQRLYEKTIPPLDVLAGAVWHFVSAGSNRQPDCQPDSPGGCNCRDSSNLPCDFRVDTNAGSECDVELSFIRYR